MSLPRRLSPSELAEQIDRLHALERVRGLTRHESEQLGNLLYRKYLRDRRRPQRIARLRARLAALEADGQGS